MLSLGDKGQKADKDKHRESQKFSALRHKYFSLRDSAIAKNAPYINEMFDNARSHAYGKKVGEKEILKNLFQKNGEHGRVELNLMNPYFKEAQTRYYICLHMVASMGDYL